MSRLRRTVFLSLAVLLPVAVAVTVWFGHRPPRVARLLPEADAILYANLKPARLATHFDRSAPPRSPDFQAFVDATGIVPERDLDEVAFALTRRPDPAGPNGPVAYTEIFLGRFDSARLAAFLEQHATLREQYAGHTLYALPSGDVTSPEPRLLRVAILRPGLITASNAPTAEQIHGVIDRDRAGLFSGSAPSQLLDLFPEVPALSMAWGIGSLGLPFAESGHVSLLGFRLPLPADQPMVASVRSLGVLRVRVAVIAPSADLALQQSGALSGLLGVLKTMGISGRGTSGNAPEAPLSAALQSVTVQLAGSQTVVTAELPTSLLTRLVSRP